MCVCARGSAMVVGFGGTAGGGESDREKKRWGVPGTLGAACPVVLKGPMLEGRGSLRLEGQVQVVWRSPRACVHPPGGGEMLGCCSWGPPSHPCSLPAYSLSLGP